MRRLWANAGVFLGKYVYAVLGVMLVVTVILAAIGLPRLDFATGQESFLNEDEQIAIDNEQYQDLFGGQAMVSLFVAEPNVSILDLFTPENVAQMEAVEAELREARAPDGEPRFDAVISPLTALRFTEALVTPRVDGELQLDEDGTPIFTSASDVTTSVASDVLLGASERERELGNDEEADRRTDDSLATLDRLTVALAEPGGASFENPAWVEFLLVDNRGDVRKALRPFFPVPPGVEPTVGNVDTAQMVVRMGGNLSIEEEGNDAVLLLDAMEDLDVEGFTITTTGAPVLLKDINDYLRGGMLTLGAIALVVMVIVLWFVFRVRWRLLSLPVVVLGLVLAFSILGIVGIPLAVVTISGLPILMGIGIDFAIQVHNRVEEEVVLDKELHPISETLVRLAPALVIATIAAVVAFLALQIAEVPMVRDFGVLLAIGIVVMCAVGIVIPTAVLGMREFRRPTTAVRPPSRIEGFVARFGGITPRAAVPFAVIAVVVLVLGVAFEDRFTIETDPEKWTNQDTEVVRDLELLREQTGSATELGFFVESPDVFDDDTVELTWEFASDQLDEHEVLLTASSVVTTVGFLMDIPDTTQLAPTGEDVQAAWEVAPPDVQVATAAPDEGYLNIVFRTGESPLEVRKALVEQMQEELAPVLAEREGVRATPSGLAVVGIGLLDNLEANRAQLTYLALALVGLWLLVRFRSFVKAMLTMVPVLLAVGTSSLVVAFAGITLSPMTTVMGPLVAAAVTEFSVLIMARYLEERGYGLTPSDASHKAAGRTGRAFVASGLTTIGGFGVLVFSALPLIRDFGVIVTINVGVALIVALIVLPPMLVFADERGLLKAGT